MSWAAVSRGWAFNLLAKSAAVLLLSFNSCEPARAANFFMGAGFGDAGQNEDVYSSFIGMGEAGFENRNLSAAFQFFHATQQNKIGTLSSGIVTMMPLMLTVQGRARLHGGAFLCIGGGMDYVMMDHQIDSSIEAPYLWFNETLSENIDSGIGYHVEGGLEFEITRNFSFGLKVYQLFFNTTMRRVFTNHNFISENQTEQDSPMNLDTIFGIAEVRWRFL